MNKLGDQKKRNGQESQNHRKKKISARSLRGREEKERKGERSHTHNGGEEPEEGGGEHLRESLSTIVWRTGGKREREGREKKCHCCFSRRKRKADSFRQGSEYRGKKKKKDTLCIDTSKEGEEKKRSPTPRMAAIPAQKK